MEQTTLSFADSLFNGSQMLDGSNETASPGDQGLVPQQAQGTGGMTFGQTLQSAVENVNSLQNDAATAATQFAIGQTSDIHTVMIAGEKATLALDLATEVRNKVVDAYQTIMQTSM
jgi:flagellar hook-basal body complex protein FliE